VTSSPASECIDLNAINLSLADLKRRHESASAPYVQAWQDVGLEDDRDASVVRGRREGRPNQETPGLVAPRLRRLGPPEKLLLKRSPPSVRVAPCRFNARWSRRRLICCSCSLEIHRSFTGATPRGALFSWRDHRVDNVLKKVMRHPSRRVRGSQICLDFLKNPSR